MHNLKVVCSVLFEDVSEDCIPGDNLSDGSEDGSEDQLLSGDARIYRSIFAGGKTKQKYM